MCDSGSRRRGALPDRDPFLVLLKRMRRYLSELGKGYAVARPMLRDGWRVGQVLLRHLVFIALFVGAWQARWHGLNFLERFVAFF
jgi:hypothetical protein